MPLIITGNASDLCTLADVRAAEEAPSPDTSRDGLISSLITAASAAIIDEVDREFAPATNGLTRRFPVDSWTLSLAPYDLRAATLVVLSPESSSPTTLSPTTDYELRPPSAPSGIYTSIRFSGYLGNLLTSDTAFRMGHSIVDITGNWGFPAIPENVRRACVLTVLAWIRRDISALGLSNEFDTQVQQPTAFGIPYEARRLLTPFKRLRAMAF